MKSILYRLGYSLKWGAICFLVASCGEQPEPTPPVIRPVRTAIVPTSREEIKRSFSGVVSSAKGTNLAFEVAGRVIEVTAIEGKRYNLGYTLARLDSGEFKNQLEGARAQLVQAQQEIRRLQQLFETGNASRSQLESGIAREKSAKSNFQSATKRVNDTVLKMPYPGVIGSVVMEPQMVVSVGQTAMTIQGEGNKEFEIGVPAELVDTLKVGMPSQITIGSIPNETFSAVVRSISPQVSQNTTYPVTLSFESEDSRIRNGLDGEGMLSLPNPQGSTIAIPVACLAALSDASKYVWIVNPSVETPGIGTVERRMIESGKLRENGTIEILSGLQPGEIVITRGVNRLVENQQVRIPEIEQ